MGYISCMSACYGCKRIFSYNPMRVPSIPIQGMRQPICEICVARVNPERIANGLEPIIPAPDAYTVADENELNYD